MNLRERIGKYELIKPLGRGATSVVYESFHPELNRVVAIKLLNHDRIFDEQSLARFRAEGEKLATLRHPHIVTIYDANYQDGRPYIVTELLEGHDLESYINRFKTFSLEDILEIAHQLAGALAATHANNIVHRDVKLSNIMVTRKQAAIHITLMDYGIARNDNTYTEEGHFIGTHAYASPEQLCCERVDHRSDIYSLGVVLYVLMSNMLPSNSLFQIKNSIPVRISDIAPVPRYIARIVEKCLEKQPKDRYQSAQAVAEALRKAKQRYLSPRLKWIRSLTAYFSRPVKQALANSLIVLLLLACLYPWLRNHYNRYLIGAYAQSVSREAGIIASQIEESLALRPQQLSLMLAAPIYRVHYDKLLLLDENRVLKAALGQADKAEIGAHYQFSGQRQRIPVGNNVIFYFPALPSDLLQKFPTLNEQFSQWILPSVDDVLEVDYSIKVMDKTIGHIVMKKHGMTGFQSRFDGYYAATVLLLVVTIYLLTFRSSRKLNRFLEYTRENLERALTDSVLKNKKSFAQHWSDENAPIPFDWEQFAAPNFAATKLAATNKGERQSESVKKATDVMQHTAREQLKLAAQFDSLARQGEQDIS